MDRYRRSTVYVPLLNEAIRTGLRLKYFKDRHEVARRCRGREAEIDQWFGGVNVFFVLSSFRSGTVFLSNLLMREFPEAHVEHEANVLDYWTMPRAREDGAFAREYIRRFRRNEIFCRSRRDVRTYGEINPFLRCHCEALIVEFPDARFLHVVRDPRDVVRSVMGRENYGRKDPMARLMRPPPNDPYYAAWPNMDRFERVCWEWQHDNRYLRQHIPDFARFEDFTTDFGAFRKDVLDCLGLDLPQSSWARHAGRPRNASRKHGMPHWSEWGEREVQTLQRICGDEMQHYGYSMA